MDEKRYTAKLHVSTGAFSFIEIDIQDTKEEIFRINAALLTHYKDTQK